MFEHITHDGRRVTFDIEAVKATKKSEFIAAHSHIPGADELWHLITGKPKPEKKEENK